MDVELKKKLYRTLSEVFETMFFTILEPLEEPPVPEEASGEDHFEAVIGYRGDREGTFRFYFPEQLARYITFNFLGLEPDEVTERQLLDTVKETANMAVGSLLGKLDPEGRCQLGIPESRRAVFPPPWLAAHPGAAAFNSEQGILWLVYEAN
ncbi:MAG: chemotaxis protein CheX [Desulfobacteraceae bacterium]|nr:chemotaxis protein CheX [Desulfobacteraceae bacterium]